MKRLILCFSLLAFIGTNILQGQDLPIYPSVIKTGVYLGLTPALRDLPALTDAEFQQMVLKGEQKILNQKLKERHYPYANTALPKGPDPVWQQEMGKTAGIKAPMLNFNGQQSPYYPPDANGSIGPNHYMQTINCVYTIYNKTTGALMAGPTNINLLFNGVTGSQYNDGDPICLYDEQADRWLVAEFSISGSNDYMLIAVSATNDPTGSWHAYSFDVADMPDYEKFGIWRDGYYMGTNNSAGNDIYVFERSQMINGLTAQMVGFNNPWRPTTIDGFMCVPPLDNDGTFAPEGSPGLFITMNDDAIGGGSDQLWVYELAVSWTTPSISTFVRSQQIDVPAFDSNFGANWNNIKQPNTTMELDGIPQVIMNVPQYRNFGSFQTIVCCHTVDVDNTDHAGIRWYELRRTTGTWTIRQSGTYAPDGHSRWMASIALNGNNQIGIGYSVSSTTVYPGIRYCGQSAGAYTAGSGILDIAEEVIQNATTSQTSYNRWGDYASVSIDPSNDNTFWFTTEYGGSRQTKIAAFNFTNPPLTAQFIGAPTTVMTGGQVNFTDQSSGGPTSWNWSFPGGTPSTSTSQNPVVTYNTAGTYSVTLVVSDGQNNDTEVKTNYITVTNISYCASQGSIYTYEWISGVNFNSFGNQSGASGYSDFTGLTVNMTPGSNIAVTLTPGFSGATRKEYWRIWIDYNHDGDFVDAGETVFAPSFSKTIVTGSFTVPSNVTGSTRMRVSMRYNAIPASCGTFTYGEVEDYTVAFVAPQAPVADFSASPTTVIAGQNVQFTDLSTNGPTSWAWTFTGGTPASSTAQNPLITYNTPGIYDVSLVATNTTGSDTETKTNYITVLSVPSCSTPVSPLNGSTSVSISTNLTWNSVPDATGYTLYFGTNNPPTNLVNGANLGNVTTYDPAGDLSYGTNYYWNIVPYNANGSPSGCAVWTFTTESPAGGPVQLSYSDFESGFGIWTDGGGDCALYTGGTYASGGVASIDIQDNSGTGSSFFLTNGVDVATPGYVQIDVEFEFISVSLETSENFWVQYFDGTTWNTVANYICPTNFSNNIFYRANVSILESSYTFPVGMKIRFMCDASDNYDDVYIDNVKITASTTANPNNYIIPISGPMDGNDLYLTSDNRNVRIYPNPAYDQLNVELENSNLAEIFIYDMQGHVVQHMLMNDTKDAIDLTNYRTGIYMILIITREESYRTKFIKK